MAPVLLLRSLVVLVAFCTRGTFSQHERPAAVSSSFNATCPARTVNYITHTLPQLCLTSSRTVPNNTTTSDIGNSYLSKPTDHAPASSQKTTILEQSSLASTNSITVAVSPALSTHGTKSPPRPAAELGTKADDDNFDSDSDLANAKFLSFEDWKRQNLAKSGQAEHVGISRQNDVREPRRKPAPVSDALDSLGDDAEIDLDFASFAAGRPDIVAPGQSTKSNFDGEGAGKEEVEALVKSKSRSNDAGTTCKERFNYASFDCAATVLKTNPEAKGSSTVLSENKDSYMLNECSAETKFLILELCNDISIDTIVLANFEFFSSIFRTFRVSVSDRYPVKIEKWKTLGTFEARNSREVQAFLVENPLIWARYLKMEFLTHYGSEYYCPVSLIRVHGTTMMEDYKHDLEASRADDDEDEAGTSNPMEDVKSLVSEAAAEVLVPNEEAHNQAASQDQTSKLVAESQPSSFVGQIPIARSSSASMDVELCPYNKANEEMREMAAAFTTSQLACSSSEYASVPVARNATAHTSTQEKTTSADSPLLKEDTVTDGLPLIPSNISSAVASAPHTRGIDPVINSTLVNVTDAKAETSPSDSRSTATKTADASYGENTKTTASSTQPSPAGPTIQESFFKSVQKRLQMLEANSSLSLQYIEEQSRNLRDAFGRVEQRQLSKTTTFLEYLNTTVLSELRDFRQQYDQLWQSTVIELDIQREQYQKEVLAINSRLAMLADEVIFQKRMTILQSMLVLICLGLVLFSRGAMNNYLELPIVQSMLARSPSLRRLNSQILQTPTESPATTRPSSSHKQNAPYGILKSHRSQVSEDSVVRSPSPTTTYSPPTPTSCDAGSGFEESNELSTVESLTPDHDTIMRPNSSPPMLTGAKDMQASDWHVCETTGAPLAARTEAEPPMLQVPRLTVEEAPPPAKHLSFRLPEG